MSDEPVPTPPSPPDDGDNRGLDVPSPIEKPGINRIVVVENVYHQGSDGMPTTHVYPRYTQFLTTDEQPYQRHTKVGEEWVRLDTGWLNECSLIVLENTEGLFQFRNPTKEEVEETKKKVIEIGFISDAIALQRESIKVEVDPVSGKKLGRTMHSPPRVGTASMEIEPVLQIPPLQSQRIIPISPRMIYVRSRFGVTRMTITAFPV